VSYFILINLKEHKFQFPKANLSYPFKK